jgi:hypothetical protein
MLKMAHKIDFLDPERQITIMQKHVRKTVGRLLLCLGSLAACPGWADAEDNASFGLLFERFQLTLEDGFRTEAAGPFYYFQRAETSQTTAFPPFFSCHRDPAVAAHEDDFLYPVWSSLHYGQEWRWQLFQLISGGGGQDQDATIKSRFTLFPFYFQQRSTNPKLDYTAVVPFYGHLQNRLSRDRIFFVMFPFYSETRKRDVVTDNYLYPFVHVREGNGLRGWQVWPFVGSEHKLSMPRTNGFGEVETIPGHDRSFVLWPLWLRQDNGLGTTNQEKFRASIPLFASTRSPKLDSTTVIWPFFTWMDNRDKKYREWQMPWPFIIFARGEGKTTDRVFPLFSFSHNAVKESDSVLWPVYTYRRTHSDPLDQRRTRVLFYLYSDAQEINTQTRHSQRRLDMWPFFTWHREFDGRERLQVLALLEPILPNNRGVERNWSPLWSLWRAEENPKTGAASQSLLWNLYRHETAPAHRKTSLLFGLFQRETDGGDSRTRLFYITVAKSSAAPTKLAAK